MRKHLSKAKVADYTVESICFESVSKSKFPFEGTGLISVKDYFKKQKNIALKHPNGPCLKFTNKNLVPAEV